MTPLEADLLNANSLRNNLFGDIGHPLLLPLVSLLLPLVCVDFCDRCCFCLEPVTIFLPSLPELWLLPLLLYDEDVVLRLHFDEVGVEVAPLGLYG